MMINGYSKLRETLKDRVDESKLPLGVIANKLALSRNQLNLLIEDQLIIDWGLACKISWLFGDTPNFWLILQAMRIDNG